MGGFLPTNKISFYPFKCNMKIKGSLAKEIISLIFQIIRLLVLIFALGIIIFKTVF